MTLRPNDQFLGARQEPSFAFARQETDTPTSFLQDGEEIIAADEARGDSLASILTLRAGLPFESQLTLSLPYIYTNTDTVTRIDGAGEREESLDASGFGDLSVTLAKGVMRERGWRPATALSSFGRPVQTGGTA